MAKTDKKDELAPTIVIKKVIKKGGGHHGGAWKVAYADFVTAMMAFFLLLWLLNVSTDEARSTISNFFDPTHPKIAETRSGAGGIMGGTSTSPDGAMTTNVQPLTQTQPTGQRTEKQKQEKTKPEDKSTAKKLEAQLKKQQEENFKKAKAEIEKKMQESPELKELIKNLMVDITSEGMRIQLIDQEGKPLFPMGSSEMFDYTKKVVAVVSQVIQSLPNDISVRGHTDAHQYAPGAKYTNWELSADRANSCRRELLLNSITDSRLANVMGRADKEPLIVEDPLDARNRRLTIIMLNESLERAVERGAFGPMTEQAKEEIQKEIEEDERREQEIPDISDDAFHKTQGKVYFP